MYKVSVKETEDYKSRLKNYRVIYNGYEYRIQRYRKRMWPFGGKWWDLGTNREGTLGFKWYVLVYNEYDDAINAIDDSVKHEIEKEAEWVVIDEARITEDKV